MKHTCPKCRRTIDIPEGEILQYIAESKTFRHKCESVLSSIRATGQSERMTPEQRRERARIAVAAREAKRASNKPAE
jgi:hypothetical protein